MSAADGVHRAPRARGRWLARMRALRCGAWALASAAACASGPTPATFAPAQSPAGIHVRVDVPSRRVEGELLEVRDRWLLVRDTARLVRVPWRRVEWVGLRGWGEVHHGRRDRLPEREVARLRPLARFPQGLAPDVERRVLDAMGRDSVETLAP